jgi:phosphoglycerate dehydrogenase-like enzyme
LKTRVLVSDTVFRRLQPRFGALASQLECLVMDDDGVIRLDGREMPAAEANPECGLISHDVFFNHKHYLAALMHSTQLKWVQSAGAGVDHPMFVMLAEKGVRLTTNHSQAVGIAEYVMGGVLSHFQAREAQAAYQAARRWNKRYAREISGTRWLIIGFGAIGQAVAQRAKAFDAHVTGVRRQIEQSPFADEMATPDQLFDHLGGSDVVVLCLPHTPKTINLVDAEFLAAMKAESMLVNVGRGSLIDEDALLAALDAGKPEHALLDVFRVEPLPPKSRFWSHPRVTVTAHTSALSSGLQARTDKLFLDNLARYLARQTVLNEVPASEVLGASGER